MFLVESVIDELGLKTDEEKEKIKSIYLAGARDLSVCDKQKMLKVLNENGLSPEIHETIMRDLKTKDFTAKEGILDLDATKVRGLYSHLFENGNKYDRVTFDNVAKYSGYVSADGETYATDKMEKMQRFCEAHGMKTKINALMFYADFPKVYEQSLDNRVKNGEITEQDKKELIKKSLFDYVRDIGKRYGDRVESVDIFNELIYDPVMKEEGFDEQTPEYQYRSQGWHKYLSLEDMCKMAVIARKQMPNVKFTYNDMNWTDPEKRKQIIGLLKDIKQVEEKFRTEGVEIDGRVVKLGENESLVDSIGFEAHLMTDVDLEQMEQAFNDVTSEIGLPIEITELDVAHSSDNYELESKRQGKVFEKIMRMVKEHPEITSLTIWSQSDICSFMDKKIGRKSYASVLDSDFREKDFEPTLSLEDKPKSSECAFIEECRGKVKTGDEVLSFYAESESQKQEHINDKKREDPFKR